MDLTAENSLTNNQQTTDAFVAFEEGVDSDDRHFRFQITERELLCVNKCGFYGTPQWNGLCSQCWRNYQLEKKRNDDFNKNKALLAQQQQQENGGESSRKTSDARFTTIRSILKRSPSVFSNSEILQPSISPVIPAQTSSSPIGTRSLSPESRDVQHNFQKYLSETFAQSLAKDLEKQCRLFIEKLFRSEHLPLDELSEMVQQFYQTMTEKLSRLKPIPEHFKLSEFMAELEEFVCNRAYTVLFCSKSDEEMEDLALQERIRSLHWVTFGFLETSLDFSSNQVEELFNEAITQIVDLNSHRSIVRKLDCLINCSKHIFDALKESRSGAAASADDFFPVLILVILKANPPLIQSNMKFISRFSLPFRVMRGESGYYFTNLSCAVQFILTMNAHSLRLSNEEFEAYTSGKRVAPTRMSNSVVKSIEMSLKRLDDLIDSQGRLGEKVEELERKFHEDSANFTEAIRNFAEEKSREEVHNVREQLRKIESEDVKDADGELETKQKRAGERVEKGEDSSASASVRMDLTSDVEKEAIDAADLDESH